MKFVKNLCVVAFVLPAAQGFANPASGVVHYRLSLQNVTAGNGISPFVSLVHKHKSDLFKVGNVATPGLAEIAETGGTSILERELAANPIVLSVKKADGAPLAPAETRVVEFTVPYSFVERGARLTVLGMIGMSNDSFVAARSLELKNYPVGSTTIQLQNYDAGSEENSGNTEDFGAGGHPTQEAEGLISFDRGLNPRGNAPDIIAWGSVAAQATLERLD